MFIVFNATVFAQPPKEELFKKADSLYNEGIAIFDNYQYKEAIVKFTQAIELYTKFDAVVDISKVLNKVGEAYNKINEDDVAKTHYDRALAIARKKKNKNIECIVLKNIGKIYALKQPNTALVYYDSALFISKEVKNKKTEGEIFMNIGVIYTFLDQNERAFAYYDSALLVATQENDMKLIGDVLGTRAWNFITSGKFEKTLKDCDSALTIFKQIDDKSGKAKALIYAGLACMHLGEYEKSLAYNDSALTTVRFIKDKTNERAILVNMGALYTSLGYYEKAFALYDSALVITNRLNTRWAQPLIHLLMGQIYMRFDRCDQAKIHYDSALVIARETKWKLREREVLINIGNLNLYLRQYNNALAYYDSARTILKIEAPDIAQCGIYLCLGSTHYELANYDKALLYLDSGLVIAKEMKDRSLEGEGFNSTGDVYFALKQYGKALAYYDSALIVFTNMKDKDGESIVLYNIGQSYEEMKDIETAIVYYKQAIDIRESIRMELKQEIFKASIIERDKKIYEQLINILIQLMRYEEAFDYLERSRSQELRKAIEEKGITALDPSLKRMLESINYTETALAAIKQDYQDKKLTEDAFQQKTTEFEGLLNQKYLDLKANHPQLYNLMMPQMKEYHYIQRSIPKKTVYLEFTTAEDKYVVFILTKDQFRAKTYDVSKSVIDSTIEQALNVLKWLKDKEIVDSQFAAIYDLLIKPLEPDIEKFPDVIIIPYGLLHYVPFNSLRRQKADGDFEYFVQWKKISYLPSALFITDLFETKAKAKKDLLAFVNCDGSLPSAEIEVDSILKVYPKATVFRTSSATKEKLINCCWDYKLLHFATHSVLNSDPRFSCIVLSPPDQGNLTVREIVGLSGKFQNTTLVTLSACETAIEEDPRKAGMELTTLSNAFKVAGVPTIVATLWEIGDRSTAVLMKDFYGNLKKKKGILEALRQAQLSMIQDPAYGHPYYWAPFVLIGDWR